MARYLVYDSKYGRAWDPLFEGDQLEAFKYLKGSIRMGMLSVGDTLTDTMYVGDWWFRKIRRDMIIDVIGRAVDAEANHTDPAPSNEDLADEILGLL